MALFFFITCASKKKPWKFNDIHSLDVRVLDTQEWLLNTKNDIRVLNTIMRPQLEYYLKKDVQIYEKLDADLASALMGINAVKGVEIGAGFNVVKMSGEQNSDEMTVDKDGKVKFLSNNAGGILGGISSGQDLVCRLAVKPTSSILKYQKTITTSKTNTKIRTKGRHDPCVGIRCVPVAEAMVSLVLADHLLRNNIYRKIKGHDQKK